MSCEPKLDNAGASIIAHTMMRPVYDTLAISRIREHTVGDYKEAPTVPARSAPNM